MVADSDRRDVDRAVEAAVGAFPAWSSATADERSRVLLRIADLIERAKRHELGLDFLRNGAQECVAAVFRVHAFTVDAARRELAGSEPAPGGEG